MTSMNISALSTLLYSISKRIRLEEKKTLEKGVPPRFRGGMEGYTLPPELGLGTPIARVSPTVYTQGRG